MSLAWPWEWPGDICPACGTAKGGNAPVPPDHLIPDRVAGAWDLYLRCAATDLFAGLTYVPEDQLGHLEHAHPVFAIKHFLKLFIGADERFVLRVL